MKRHALFVLTLAAATTCLLAIAFTLFIKLPRLLSGNQNLKSTVGLSGPCQDSADEARDDCLLAIAQTDLSEEKDLVICLSIVDQQKQDSCFMASVNIRHNVNENFLGICEKINFRENQDKCYSTLAGFEADSGFCHQIISSGLKDDCFQAIAKRAAYDNQTESVLLCEQIVATAPRENCLLTVAMISQNEAVCRKFSSREKIDDCYYYLATTLFQQKICDQIENKTKKSDCQKKSVFRGV